MLSATIDATCEMAGVKNTEIRVTTARGDRSARKEPVPPMIRTPQTHSALSFLSATNPNPVNFQQLFETLTSEAII